MFNSLVESGSHSADLRRRGKFFLGATAFYAVLLAVTGVGSIYAYNASIDDGSDLEVLSIIRFSPPEARPEPARREEQRPAPANNRDQQYATRVGEISVNTPYHGDRVASAGAKDVRADVPVRLGDIDSDPASVGGGPARTNYVGPGGDGHGDAPKVDDGGTPPPPAPAHTTPAPAPPRESKPVRMTSSVLTGKAISKPAPVYPPIAKAAGVQGVVSVQVLIDEQGRVLDAKVTDGHPLLRQAAVQNAYKWKFTPTVLNGEPVKVMGVVMFNFTLNK